VAWRFLPLWPWQVGLVAATVAGISAELAEPLLHQRLVNRVLLAGQLRLLPGILGLYVLAATAHWLAHSAAHYMHLQGSERFSIRLRTRMYAHLRRLGLRALGRQSTGELVAAVQQFGPEVGEDYLALLHSVVASCYRLPASLALLARLNLHLLVLALPALTLYPLYPVLTARPLRRALANLALYDVHTQGVVNDRVAGLAALWHRVDARGDVGEVERLLWRRLRLRLRAFVVDRLGGLLDVAAHQGLAVLLFGLGGLAVWRHQMTVGALLAFLEYVRGLEGPVRRLMHLPVGAQRLAVVADRAFAVLDLPVDVVPPRRGRSARSVRGDLALRRAGVRGLEGRPILEDVTCAFPAGRLVAVVGPSGAGKSTLGALLPRLLDPDEGAVLLDGVDLRAYDLAELRAQVAYVPQEPVFFQDTLEANLRVARPEATEGEIWAALERAQATDFVARTPGPGLTYRLAEGAANLSGGQRRRLGLARGLLQGGRVLVLDEALSGLDPRLAERVFAELRRLRGQVTVVLITHQWELARRADVAVLLEGGRVVRQGPPWEVLRP
jgi:ATP-binding cassette subfamily B protein